MSEDTPVEDSKYTVKVYEHKNKGYGTHWHVEIKAWNTDLKIQRQYFSTLLHDLGHIFLALTNDEHHPREVEV